MTQLGGTAPIWPVITYQVDPQISSTIVNGISTLARVDCGAGAVDIVGALTRSHARG